MAATQPSAPPAPAAAAAAARSGENIGTRQGAVLLVALLAACLYAAFAHGATGFPAETRLQVSLAALALAAAALWAGDRGIDARAPRLAVWGVAALVAFAAWSGLTLLWSVAPDRTWLEVNRALTYALVVALGIAVGTSAPRAIERLAVGWLVVSVSVALYALAGKALPGVHISGVFDFDNAGTVARLRSPLDYWNALALVCALGVPVAVRMAVDDARRLGIRLVALAAVYLLVIDIGMTYSRGGVLALVTAIAVMTALGGARLRGLAVLGIAGVAAVAPLAVAFSRDGLTTNAAPLSLRITDGRVLLGTMVFCLAGLIAGGWALATRVEPRAYWTPAHSRRVWRGIAVGAVAAGLIGVVALAASDRGLTGSIDHFAHGFTDIKQDKQFDPVRLTSTNSGNRWVWWKEAIGTWSDRPAGGWGAGSFPVTHLQYRTNTLPVSQPHSVPLQFLAETGLIGLLLAFGGLGLLGWVAFARVRDMPASRERDLAVALLAGAAGWVVHGAYDWDWDIPGVTVPVMLFLGVLAAAPGTPRDRPPVLFVDPERGVRGVPARGLAMVAATLVACAFAASSVLPAWSDAKAADAQAALGDQPTAEDYKHAAAQADLAARLDPLAVEPLLATAAIAHGRGRLLEERADLLDAVKRQPDSVVAWTQLAAVAFELADRKGFEDAALRALALDPQNANLKKVALRAVAFATPPGQSATATGTPLPAAGAVAPAATTQAPVPPPVTPPVTTP